MLVSAMDLVKGFTVTGESPKVGVILSTITVHGGQYSPPSFQQVCYSYLTTTTDIFSLTPKFSVRLIFLFKG